MQQLPLLFGTRVVIVDAPDDAVILRPPPPGEQVADVRAAIRDAFRFPLAGDPLEALVTRGGRATIVVEPPTLPIPGHCTTRGRSPSQPPRQSSSGRACRWSARPSSSPRG